MERRPSAMEGLAVNAAGHTDGYGQKPPRQGNSTPAIT
jgi:hypothetical protein